MAYEKKTWVNRTTEYPTRRTLIPVSGIANTYDVSRAEGETTTEGDTFSANNMNSLETRINSAFDGKSIKVMTEADYNNITPDNSVIYFLTD